MGVMLRLMRCGRRNRPFWRIVAAEKKAPRDGRHLDRVGTYNPIPNKEGLKEIRLKEDRIKYWLSVGAQPSDKVAWILGHSGLTPMPPQRFSAKKMIPKSERKKGFSTFAAAQALCLI